MKASEKATPPAAPPEPTLPDPAVLHGETATPRESTAITPFHLRPVAKAPAYPPMPSILLEGDFPPAEEAEEHPIPDAKEPSFTIPIPWEPASDPIPGGEVAAPAMPPHADVWMAARDPGTLLVAWCADAEEMRGFEAANPTGRWEWRLHAHDCDGPTAAGGPLHPGRAFEFVAASAPGIDHVAEVGFAYGDGGWMRAGRSEPVAPPEPAAWPDLAGRTTTEMSPADPGAEVSESRRTEGLQVALEELLREESSGSPAESSEASDRRGGLAEAAHLQPSGEALPAIDAPEGTAVSSEAFAVQAGPRARPFWFRVNAELVVYGSTEPDAAVRIGGHPVTLRRDGSFSFRFALPDGEYSLPLHAVSAAGDDGRSAVLGFRRETTTTGVVGEHPGPPELRPPGPASPD